MSVNELKYAARSQPEVVNILANSGTIVRRWETPELTVSFVRIQPWRVTRSWVHQLEHRALRKLREIPELRRLVEVGDNLQITPQVTT